MKSVIVFLLLSAIFSPASVFGQDSKNKQNDWMESAMQALLEDDASDSREKRTAQASCEKKAKTYEEKTYCFIPEAFKKDSSLLVKYPLP
ncbi:MAG: hypothetical protein HY445_00315 [Candidatus Niyogibacteria bacterium]|nr:hypothetical protein [Candidatus Niyogibacteria bacterium]